MIASASIGAAIMLASVANATARRMSRIVVQAVLSEPYPEDRSRIDACIVHRLRVYIIAAF
jgi:hypothetical protein